MKTPMIEKYVDEAIGVWAIFGSYEDGQVNVCDGNRDVFKLDPDKALLVVNLHDKFREDMYRILCEEPNES